MLKYKPQWSYSLDHEMFDWETYPSKEDAIAAGIEDAKNNGYSTVYVGECEFYYPELDEDVILDSLREESYSEFGDCSELWLENVTSEESAELGKMLNDALHEWLRKTNNIPDFFIAEFSDEIEVDDDD